MIGSHTRPGEVRRPQMTEAELQSSVIELAHVFHWLAYHTHDSRRSRAGFPDVVCVRGNRVIFAELKSETGKVSPDQTEWLTVLQDCDAVETYIWRPEDLTSDRILEVLR